MPQRLQPSQLKSLSRCQLLFCPHRRSFTSSYPKPNIRFPYGVPAFPISPKMRTQQRPLPAYKDVRPNTTRNILIFISICGAWVIGAQVAINYERFSSPVTASTLHEVRKSPAAAELLGKDIQHRSMNPSYKGWYQYDGWFRQPWISGSIQLTKGKIDIAYDVKGTGHSLSAWSLTCRGGGSSAFCKRKAEQNCQMGDCVMDSDIIRKWQGHITDG